MVSLSDRTLRILVTGAAGFIGSSLVDRLLALGNEVVGFDNFSTGQENFLNGARVEPRFRCIRGDTLNPCELEEAMEGVDLVFHLAANADVRFGLDHPDRDLQQNTIATFNVLEAMRKAGVKRIAFSSTGSVYGESVTIPTPENAPFPVQTSLYGASKVAGEALIQAYCEGYKFEGYIFRFVSILGERYTHGHVFDFCRQLLATPRNLRVLGNGRQRKSYLYVQDCLDAMLWAVGRQAALSEPHQVGIYNLGTREYCEVLDSVGWICEVLGVEPEIETTGGERGWTGDNPFILLDTARINSLGWEPKLTIAQGVRTTTKWLLENRWVFEKRD
ncbi:MAG: NAD-dependent epimerase/dehydratase family protein [Acidobacteria bacterium]|nr:NAD-dependent epimerase/dehydratase family protein [Acidobacteriota bacterium]